MAVSNQVPGTWYQVCGSISSFRFVFSIPKVKASACYAVRIRTLRSDFFEFRIRWPKSLDFGPKSDDLARNLTTWAIRFSNRKMAWSLDSRCYPRQQAAAERSTRWMVTQLYSEVASHPARNRRAARLSVARLQSVGAGSGLETKKSSLGAHLSVDTYSQTTAAATGVSHIVKYKIPRQVDSTQRTRHVSSPPDRRQSAWARTVGSYAQCSALGTSLRGVRPQQQQLVSAFARISARTLNPIFPYSKTVLICELHT